MRPNRKLFTVIFLIIIGQANAQWRDSISSAMPSPNAMSLGLYGEMPVSYFTGIPDITIPLYEVKGNKINLPISLNYHASGLRPEVHPSWVGNGWSLSAGGLITRKVNGMSDEYNRLGQDGKLGYYFNHNNLNNSSWDTPPSITTYPPDSYQESPPYGNSPNEDADTEPDEFDFNFLGFSGKFFLDQTGQWQVQCDKFLKVIFDPADFVAPFFTTISGTYNPNNISPTFGKFTIEDEYGNKYIFGSKDANNTAIEFSDVMIPSSADGFAATLTATSWYLSQIISADGVETINLNYERGPLTSQLSFSSLWGGYQQPTTGNSFPNMNNFYPGCTTNISATGLSGWVTFPVYLIDITMPNNNLEIDFNKSKSNELAYVDDLSSNDDYIKLYTATPSSPDYHKSFSEFSSNFPSEYCIDVPITNVIPYYVTNRPSPTDYNYSDRFIWLKLDGIKVKNSATGNDIRFIDFNYLNTPTKRLQLLSLNVSDNTDQPVQKYSFSYNQTPLPAYLATFTDHWGFNNNIPLSFSVDPSKDFYNYRVPDPTGIQTQAEILTSIKYPTGGTTKFVYEPNTYSSVVYRDPVSLYNKGTLATKEAGIGGGVRIRQIINSDGFGGSTTKTFYYVTGYKAGIDASTLPSSGVLDTKPVYSFMNTGTFNGATTTYNIISSTSIIPTTSNSAGTLIGYSSVIEQNSNGSYSLYEYSNQDNSLYTDQPPLGVVYTLTMTSFPCTSLYFERGRLLHKADFTVNSDNTQYLTSEKYISYSNPSTLTSANALYNTFIILCQTIVPRTRAAYLMYSFPFLPTTETTKVYNSDGSGTSITTTSTLSYDQYKNVVQQQMTNSKGQSEITSYSYPNSFSSTDPSNPYSMMVDMNNVSTPIEKKVTVNGNLTGAQLHTYKAIGPSKIYNDGIYNFETSTPVSPNSVTTTSFLNMGSGKLSFDTRYTQVAGINYDPAGNVSSITKTGNDATAYLWEYNQELPVAKVSNANNIYASGTSNNAAVQATSKIYVPFALNNYVNNNITVGASGTVTLAFAYNNPYVSGSSQLAWSLIGVSQYYSGTLCSATATSSTNCGSQASTAVLNNIPPGNYTLQLDLISCSGFQNYYGYYVSVTCPVKPYAIINAQNDIAYNSFEYSTALDLNYGTGNWSGIVFSNIKSGASVTGNKYYLLTGSTLTKTALNSTQSYVVSYWSDNGPYSISGSQSTTTGATLNTENWKYYEHLVSGVSAVNVTGSGDIDELRIYPKGALMSTSTYTPLVGMTSECDNNNKITYYEYDSFNRLILIKDQDNNILKEFKYNY